MREYKYRIFYYSGYIDDVRDSRNHILDSKVIKAENLDKAVYKAFEIFRPQLDVKNVYYYRILFINERVRSVDYGSYSHFIWVEKVR